ncbi:histone H2A deubiquitinase MYSM1-like [Glandiceps talaboti]
MADDVEVDIEGIEDDGQVSSLDLHSDPNVPPSSSTNLLSEFSDPPWLLEQEPTWSLQDDMDDKSRETIEKMLLEEELYFQGRSIPAEESKPVIDKPKTSTSNKPSSSKSRGRKPLFSGYRANRLPSHKMPWTDEEKSIFEQGMEIYGRSWTRIAQLIRTRTTLQVKNYANQYFKVKAREQDKVETVVLQNVMSGMEPHLEPVNINDIDSQEAALAAVTTATPTINTIPKKTTQKKTVIKRSPFKGKNSKSPKTGTKLEKHSKRDKNDLMNTTSVEEDVVATINFDSELLRHQPICVGDVLPNTEWEDEEKDVEDAANEMEEEEIEVDIDGEDESGINGGSLLKGSSLSPETIYSTLLKSAEEPDYSTDDEISDTDNSNSNEDEDDDDLDTRIEKPTLESEETHYEANDEQKVKTLLSENIDINKIGVEIGDDGGCHGHVNYSPRDPAECGKFQDEDSDGDDSCYDDDKSLGVESDELYVPTTQEHFENDTLVTFIKENYEDEKSDPWAHIPRATEEMFMDRNVITDAERSAHSEFFDGRPMKTPQRYMKIRNFILDSWDKIKPSYLTKTSVRPGLKNCGDVNCISRIHEYLQHTGAINFNVDNPYRATRAAPTSGRKTLSKDELLAYQAVRLQTMRPRKRKIRDGYGNWIDASDAEGQTIDHDDIVQYDDSTGKSARSRPKYSKLSTYDPFKLVACGNFTIDKPAPFDVSIETSALLIMDMHAHLSSAEVIGLLGGRYNHDCHQLDVVIAEPCNSISTGLQCEMDPVSQTQACELISKSGYDVVGWYHSHPRFAPNPSVRDIETQAKYQEWFNKGGAAFIGVIVSPYNRLNTSTLSQFRCLTVSEETHETDKHRMPYQFEFTIDNENSTDEDELVTKVKELVEKFSVYHHRIDMLRQYRSDLGISYLEKMLESMNSYVQCNNDLQLWNNLLHFISEAIKSSYTTKMVQITEDIHDESTEKEIENRDISSSEDE